MENHNNSDRPVKRVRLNMGRTASGKDTYEVTLEYTGDAAELPNGFVLAEHDSLVASMKARYDQLLPIASDK